ncbi:E3 ubiquitin-protein ligase rnf213-alpha isoform X1 [Petromyzon marinus]|uniref:E3 ubiquitin-protein ligase rnf213-alpha isoform X1 n=1 Tax=Petromyzon marinus TaxID=7757 RepID=UPI003F7166FE
MKCPSCQTLCQERQKFCSECGKPLQPECRPAALGQHGSAARETLLQTKGQVDGAAETSQASAGESQTSPGQQGTPGNKKKRNRNKKKKATRSNEESVAAATGATITDKEHRNDGVGREEGSKSTDGDGDCQIKETLTVVEGEQPTVEHIDQSDICTDVTPMPGATSTTIAAASGQHGSADGGTLLQTKQQGDGVPAVSQASIGESQASPRQQGTRDNKKKDRKKKTTGSNEESVAAAAGATTDKEHNNDVVGREEGSNFTDGGGDGKIKETFTILEREQSPVEHIDQSNVCTDVTLMPGATSTTYADAGDIQKAPTSTEKEKDLYADSSMTEDKNEGDVEQPTNGKNCENTQPERQINSPSGDFSQDPSHQKPEAATAEFQYENSAANDDTSQSACLSAQSAGKNSDAAHEDPAGHSTYAAKTTSNAGAYKENMPVKDLESDANNQISSKDSAAYTTSGVQTRSQSSAENIESQEQGKQRTDTGKTKNKDSKNPNKNQGSKQNESRPDVLAEKDDPDGVDVVFWAVLAKEFKFDSETSDVYVMMQGQTLSKMMTFRLENEVHVLEGHCRLKGSAVKKNALAYKYVCKARAKKKMKYEFIYKETSSEIPYERALHIPTTFVESVWHQFDDVICAPPAAGAKGVWQRVASTARYVAGYSDEIKKKKGKEWAGELILEHILHSLRNEMKINIEIIMIQLDCLKYCFLNTFLFHCGACEVWNLNINEKQVQEILKKFVDHLQKMIFDSECMSESNKLAFAVLWVCICSKFNLDLVVKPASMICKALILPSNIDDDIWKQFQRKNEIVLAALKWFYGKCLMMHHPVSECLLSLPLLEALERLSGGPEGHVAASTKQVVATTVQQFQKKSLENENIQKSVIQMLRSHQCLLKANPHLSQLLLKMLTINSLAIFTEMDVSWTPEDMLASLHDLVHRYGIACFRQQPERRGFLQVCDAICKKLHFDGPQSGGSKPQASDSTGVRESNNQTFLPESLLISIKQGLSLLRLCKQFAYDQDWLCDVVFACLKILEVYLYLLHKHTKNQEINSPMPESHLEGSKCILDANSIILHWLEALLPTYIFKPSTWHSEEIFFVNQHEPKIWHDVLSINFEAEDFNKIWNTKTMTFLKNRIQQADRKQQIKAYCSSAEYLKTLSPSLENCFAECAIQAVHYVCEAKEEEEILRYVQTNAERLGGLLSSILENSWPKHEETSNEDIVKHLLTWQASATFLQIWGSNTKLHETMTDQAQINIGIAQSVLDTLIHELIDGSVMYKILHLAIKHKEKLLECFNAINNNASKTTKVTRTDLETVLGWRQSEIDEFKFQRILVNELLSRCEIVKNNMNDDYKNLQNNYEESLKADSKPVKTLWLARVLGKEEMLGQSLLFLETEQQEMAKQLLKLKGSFIFSESWKNQMRHMTESRKLYRSSAFSLARVFEEIWKPAYGSLETLYNDVKHGTISLGEVHKKFRNNSEESLKKEFYIIAPALDGPDCSKQDMAVWIEERLTQICHYRQISEAARSAKAVSEIVDCLGLTGDFRLLRELSHHDQETFRRNPLNSINDDLVKTKDILKGLNNNLQQSSDAFCKCSEKLFIAWIKETVKNVKELKVFVDLASISAGENDMDIDKVKIFHDAVLGYAPLLYELEADVGIDELLQALQQLQATMDTDCNIPRKLIDSCANKEWLQAVHEAHGSVERSSFVQAKTINQKGIFHIEHCSEQGKLTLKSIVRLKCVQDNECNHDEKDGKGSDREQDEVMRTYSLENLEELQNKLMLIAGKAEQGKEEVDRFLELFDGVTRLGKAYIQLYNAGNVLFRGWNALVYCDPNRKVSVDVDFPALGLNVQGFRPVIGELKELCRGMEGCLDQWQQYTNKKRTEFSHLNWYTSEQLVSLCSKLADLLKTQQSDPQSLAMLSFIKSGCTGDHVTRALKRAIDLIRKKESEQTETTLTQPPSEEVIEENTRKEESMKDKAEQIKQLLQNLTEQGIPEEHAKAAIQYCGAVDEHVLLDFVFANSMDDNSTVNRLCQEFDDAWHNPQLRHASLNDVPHPSVYDVDVKFSTLKRKTQEEFEQMLDWKSVGCEQKVKLIWNIYEKNLSNLICEEYLSLDILGTALDFLMEMETTRIQREIPQGFLKGKPNLIVCPEAEIYTRILHFYIVSKNQPLPSYDEVLICSPETMAEECEIFLRRVMTKDAHNSKIYCLANADQLTYEVAAKFLACFNSLENTADYKLAIFCSSEREHSHLPTTFDSFRISTTLSFTDSDLKDYLKSHCIVPQGTASVFPDRRNISLVTSKRAGVGKSLFVQKLVKHSEDLLNNPNMDYVTVRLMDSKINETFLVETFLTRQDNPSDCIPRVFHVDVTPGVKKGFDTLLMRLFVLGHLQSTDGRVWRCKKSDVYVVEYLDWHPTKELVNQRKQRGPILLTHVLPTVTCISPLEVLQLYREKTPERFDLPLMDKDLFEQEVYQRPLQYLRRFTDGANLDAFHFDLGKVEETPMQCLEILLHYCGVSDPSWAELQNFARFLNVQLQDSETSVYCNVNIVGDTLVGFKHFIVKFMTIMAKDFATPSLELSDESARLHNNRMEDVLETLETYSIRKRWESQPHPYVFFNADHTSMTFLGFHINATCDAVDPSTYKVLLKAVMTKQLHYGLTLQRVPFNINFDNLPRLEKLVRLSRVFGIEYPEDPDENYELTTDNVMKMLAIHMRFRSGIPVIIMGETGCGKTKLIRYMCDLQKSGREAENMILVKVHGGVTPHFIYKKIQDAEELAIQNEEFDMDTVLFFDEANTTEAIYAIKEALCDSTVEGRAIRTQRLKIIAACNPYRKHTDQMIDRLEAAGLGYRIRAEDTEERMGKIPLRQLVYRVQPLPPSMLPFVWDFGQLSNLAEQLYIKQIVQRHSRTGNIPTESTQRISAVLSASQEYLRTCADECSFVSLRDVERCLKVLAWFYEQRDTLFQQMEQLKSAKGEEFVEERVESEDEEVEEEDQAEIELEEEQEEEEEEEEEEADADCRVDDVTRALILALGVCYHASLEKRQKYRKAIAPFFNCSAKEILNEIILCQDVFLKSIDLESTIAKNAALKENVFMMVVCVEQRIPLFLVGKPGSSKSLAKTIVADAMQGKSARSDLFRGYKQLHLVSFQCSPHSSSEGIISTFRQSAHFQQNQNFQEYVSVVVLDEVGLAEDSPQMPLKALHPLLEDGCVDEEKPEQYKKVGFIGISNWALDPAKMNRGILVFRGVPDEKELIKSARGICSSDPVISDIIEILFSGLARAYLSICKAQEKEFFGLRDYYSLVKMLFAFTKVSNEFPSPEELLEAILRNFGGHADMDAIGFFKDHLAEVSFEYDTACISSLKFIKENIKKGDECKESRYLLLLTSNSAALNILNTIGNLDMEDTIYIYGSSFPKDQEYTQVCRNINKIKVCMETGKTVILLNIQNLYESLYDALNQYYVYLGGNRYVDLGLGSHRVKCRVQKKFRLIVIEEKAVVYEKFPVPLINRLEKHCLEMNTILEPEQRALTKQLQDWARDFASGSQQNFSAADVFIGYHEDACASIVVQQCERHRSDMDESEFLSRAKEVLLQCATPDAVLRHTSGAAGGARKVIDLYFEKQKHRSLLELLRYCLQDVHIASNGIHLEISTHSKLLSQLDAENIGNDLKFEKETVCLLTLQQFETEQEFCQELSNFFKKKGRKLLLLQYIFDDPHISPRLISCAKYCILNQKLEDSVERSELFVAFITKVPRVLRGCGYIGFNGGPWWSMHLDELVPPGSFLVDIKSLYSSSISSLLVSPVLSQEDGPVGLDTRYLLSLCLQPAAAMLEDRADNVQRTMERIPILLRLFGTHSGEQSEKDPSGPVSGEAEFVTALQTRVAGLLKEQEMLMFSNESWTSRQASSLESILHNGTFRQALWQHLQKVVSSALAGVLAAVDQDNNLDLLDESKQPPHIIELWLQILSNENILPFQSIAREANVQIPVPRSTDAGLPRHSELPFSWLFYESIQTLWIKIQDHQETLGSCPEKMLQRQFDSTPLGQLLASLPGDCSEDILTRYSNDFVCMAFQPRRQEELKLLSSALIRAIHWVHHEEEQRSSVPPVVWLHVVATRARTRLDCFCQLARILPDILTQLCWNTDLTAALPHQEMVLDLDAVQACLELLQPRQEKLQQREQLWQWSQQVTSLKPVVNSCIAALANSPRGTEAITASLQKMRSQWRHLLVVHMYTDRLSDITDPKIFGVIVKHLFLLWKILQVDSDLSKQKPMQCIINLLKNCNNQSSTLYFRGGVKECRLCREEITDPAALPCEHVFCMKCLRMKLEMRNTCPTCQQETSLDQIVRTEHVRHIVEQHSGFRKRLTSFFVDIVAQFCFGSGDPPSQEVIQMLLDLLFRDPSEGQDIGKSKTRGLSPFEECMDPNPVIRSLLLKLLLGYRFEDVRQYLDTYLHKMGEATSLEQGDQEELCYMVIRCIEDSLHAEGLDEDMSRALDRLSTLQLPLQDRTEQDRSIATLISIAHIRFCLNVATAVLYQEYSGENQKQADGETEGVPQGLSLVGQRSEFLSRLSDELRLECSPLLQNFLIRSVYHRYGYAFLLNLLSKPQLGWAFPACVLRSREEAKMLPDRFLVHGAQYCDFRDALAAVGMSEDSGELHKCLKASGQMASLPLAVFKEVVLPSMKPHTQPTEQTLKMIVSALKGVASRKNSSALSLCHILLGLMEVQRDENEADPTAILKKLGMFENQEATTEIDWSFMSAMLKLVVHLAAVLLCSKPSPLLGPLHNLATNTASMATAFLPTMPDDLKADSFTWEGMQQGWRYECPNGHVYVIENCGQPNFVGNCMECNAEIGGLAHKLLEGSKRIESAVDQTQTGHVLGDPDARSSLIPERNLPPTAQCLMRALTHSAMLWGYTQDPQVLKQLIKPAVAVEDIPTFLLGHLQVDLTQLGLALGRNWDDALTTAHLLLTSTGQKPGQWCKWNQNLNSKKSRTEWETHFIDECIKPFLEGLDGKLQDVNERMSRDHQMRGNVLVRLIYASSDVMNESEAAELPCNEGELMETGEEALDHTGAKEEEEGELAENQDPSEEENTDSEEDEECDGVQVVGHTARKTDTAVDEENGEHQDTEQEEAMERASPSSAVPLPSSNVLWRYEARLTPGRLAHLLEKEGGREAHPVLWHVLMQEQKLKLLRFLPELLQLQQKLISYFRHRPSLNYTTLSVSSFLERFNDERERQVLSAQIDTFWRLWSSVQLLMKESGSILPEALATAIAGAAAPMSLLLPQEHGLGLCARTVTRILIGLHNDLVEMVQRFSGHRVRCVGPAEVTAVDALSVDVERDVLPLALSTCEYWLEGGRPTVCDYAFPLLERRLVDRFLLGKPRIKDIPSFSDKQNYNILTVLITLQKKIAQEPLSVATQRRVMDMLRVVSDVSEVIFTLTVAVEFLAAVGGDGERPLADYVVSALHMDYSGGNAGTQVLQLCRIKQSISLWKLLTAWRAELLLDLKQEPVLLMLDSFQKDLNEDQQEALEQRLPGGRMEGLILELHAFVLLELRPKQHSNIYNPTWSLADTLRAHLERQGERDEAVDSVCRLLPDDVTLGQVLAVWKAAVECRRRTTQHRLV